MKKIILLIVILCLSVTGVSAMEFTAPEAPESAEQYLPEESSSFGGDLWQIIKSAISTLQPNITEAAGVCLSITAIVLLVAILRDFSGMSRRTVELVGTLTISVLMIQSANSLIQLGVQTVEQISEYGKLLLPVMTAAMAAQGGTSTSAALYAGTVAFNTFLTTAISKLIIPMLYVYIVLCIAGSAVEEELIMNMQKFVMWLMTWCLKITIYLFTGYMGITGVVSGTTDGVALKAVKLSISGFVPVVGNIISEASESILVSAGVMKNSVGIYGMLVILAMWIGPFLKIAVQYILLKVTGAICGVFGNKTSTGLVQNFSRVMGLLLAMTGTVCLLFLISTVCFMKGVS